MTALEQFQDGSDFIKIQTERITKHSYVQTSIQIKHQHQSANQITSQPEKLFHFLKQGSFLGNEGQVCLLCYIFDF